MPAPVLTRIRLNLAHGAVRADLADTEGLHKTLMRLVPDTLEHVDQARRIAGLLFRLDEDEATPTLLIQTQHPPNTPRLPTGYGTIEQRSLAPLHAALSTGMLVRYRITASPVVDRWADAKVHPVTGKRRGKRTPARGDEALAWWQRRATTAGLHLLSATATPRPFRRRDRTTAGPYHALTRFDGTACITDAAQLATALNEGIGPGKAYGAGLLTLTPVHA